MKKEKSKPTPTKYQGCSRSQAAPLRFCVSSPHIGPSSRSKPNTSSVLCDLMRPFNAARSHPLSLHRTGSFPLLVPTNSFHTSDGFAKGKPPGCCPCPFPCGPCGCPCGCNCLPPPCNTPPKCIQYMTGYYYYPYGFWFCGPYHVTGTCVPAGPCKPGGPCGPCACPCPCPCPKCCACLSPLSTAVVGGDPEPQPKCASSQQHQGGISSPLSYCEPQPQSSSNHPSRSKGGISKFFPFTSVPTLMPLQRLPHSCPYSTQPYPQPPAVHTVYPVFCAQSMNPAYNSCNSSSKATEPSYDSWGEAKPYIFHSVQIPCRLQSDACTTQEPHTS